VSSVTREVTTTNKERGDCGVCGGWGKSKSRMCVGVSGQSLFGCLLVFSMVFSFLCRGLEELAAHEPGKKGGRQKKKKTKKRRLSCVWQWEKEQNGRGESRRVPGKLCSLCGI